MDLFNALHMLLHILGLGAGVFLFVVLSMLLVVRPWDAETSRAYKLPLSTPYPVFWVAAWVYAVADWLAAKKPAPMRIAEISNAFVGSQVLFSIVSLGIPDALLSGPATAAELAAAVGHSTNTNWLDRLLSAAAVMGMLKRARISQAAAQQRAAAAKGRTANGSTISNGKGGVTAKDLHAKVQLQPQTKSAAAAAVLRSGTSGDTVYEYSLNALSAALTQKSPVNMSSFVAMVEDDYAPFAKLSEGIRTGTIPYELHTGGQGFWEWSSEDPTRATRFDLAMVAVNHYGGSAVVNTYPWGHYDCVVDVAGGVGGFMADVMRKVPGLSKGVVFDLASNINRAKEIWSHRHPQLLSKVDLVAGDMFDAATVPSPPPDSSSTAYVLRNILHDWSDAECIKILQAIRSSVDRTAAAAKNGTSSSRRVRLLIVEVTTAEEVLPCHLPFRHASDLVMMVSFGDGKERNQQQFRSLFEASGWRLTQVTPTSGIFMVIEAEPI